jgi:hypothetical protein
MDGGTWDVWVLGLVGILVFIGGPFLVWLALYRWMWKQRGRGFAEGYFMVVDEREGRNLRRELYPGQRRTAAPELPTAPSPVGSVNIAPTDPDVHAQYTITGKRIR